MGPPSSEHMKLIYLPLPLGSAKRRLRAWRPVLAMWTRAASKCSSHSELHRPHATATALAASAETFSDRAATSYGSEGWGFESLRARPMSPQRRADFYVQPFESSSAIWPNSGRIKDPGSTVEPVGVAVHVPGYRWPYRISQGETAVMPNLPVRVIKAARCARRGLAPALGLCLLPDYDGCQAYIADVHSAFRSEG
jgi:hypothetical protein